MISKGFLFVLVSALAVANSRSAETSTAGVGVYSQPAPDTVDKDETRYSQPVRYFTIQLKTLTLISNHYNLLPFS